MIEFTTASTYGMKIVQDNSGYLDFYSRYGGAYNSTPTLHFDTANSRVGFFTNAPRAKFDAAGSLASLTVGTETNFAITRRTQSGVWDQLVDLKVGRFAVNGTKPNTRLDFALKNSDDGTLVADTTVMTLQSDGNVGIGKTAPITTLDVHGTASASAYVGIGTIALTGTGSNSFAGSLDITKGLRASNFTQVGTSTNYFNGNLGIGMTTPGAKLDILSAGAMLGLNVNTGALGDDAGVASFFRQHAQGGSSNAFTISDQIGYGGNQTGSTLLVQSRNDNATNDGNIVSFNSGTSLPGTARFVVKLNGNVGIGNISPDAKFDVTGNIIASSSGNVDFILRSATTNGASNNNDAQFTLRTGSASERFDIINGAGTKLMSIASSGNVGIGTTGPWALNTISGTAATPDGTHHGSSAILSVSSPGYYELAIGVMNTAPYSAWLQSRYTISDSTYSPIVLNPVGGNVGIGTTNPGALLQLHNNVAGGGEAIRLSSSNSITANEFGSLSMYSNGSRVITMLGSNGAINGSGTILRTNTSEYGWVAWMDNINDIFAVQRLRASDGGNIGMLRLDNVGNLTIRGALTQNGNPDVAENIRTTDTTVEAGDVVMSDPFYTASASDTIYNHVAVKKASGSASILGVISSNPGIILNGPQNGADAKASGQRSAPNERPLAIAGRIPVKVSEENGIIHVGDRLTLSNTLPGYAMKQTTAGQSLGIALEDFTNTASPSDKVLALLNLSYWAPSISAVASGSLDPMLILQATDSSGFTLASLFNFILDQFGKIGIHFGNDGTVTATKLTGQQICVDDVCVDKTQFKTIIQNSGAEALPSPTPTPSDSPTPTPDISPSPTPDPSVTPTPEPTDTPVPSDTPSPTP